MSHLLHSRRIPSSVETAATLAVLFLLVLTPLPARAQAPPATVAELGAHITNLSSLDFPTRMNAARMIRRAPPAEAVAALRQAMAIGRDEFIRYRAFVLLSSFNDRSMAEVVRTALRDRNDRLREAGYKWLEQNPDPAMATTLLAALQTEQAEFVRPALVGALAALGENAQVQRALIAETTRGVDFFRSAVIDALGRHRGVYAADSIAGVAALEGPLQDDAVLALGRIGGARAKTGLAAVAKAPPDLALTIRAAQCLAGDACDATLKTLVESATAANAPAAIVRAAVGGLEAIASEGNQAATTALVGLAQRTGYVRDQAALALASAAVRNPAHVIAWLDSRPENVRAPAIELLRDGFEDLEEDFGEEQFFAVARASYWKAAEGSSGRTLAATLIQKLEF
jgi:HEAT repeat protein